MKRRLILFISILAVLFLVNPALSVAAVNQVEFTVGESAYLVDGQTLQMDAVPFIDSGRTFVPVRYLANALGVPDSGINWDEDKKMVSLSRGDLKVSLVIGVKALLINDRLLYMDVAPVLSKDRTYLPARYVAEALGGKVSWDELTQKVLIDLSGEVQLPDMSKVTIETSRGSIVLELYPELMPVTVANFEKLVNAGFYDGLTFHRVEDWVIQGGCPNGNGTGGPGWHIPLEIKAGLKNVRGAVAMARSSDPNSAGSQFYILKQDAAWLDGKYAVFGKVLSGMEVVDQIVAGEKIISVK